MKNIVTVVLIGMLVLAGCSAPEEEAVIAADPMEMADPIEPAPADPPAPAEPSGPQMPKLSLPIDFEDDSIDWDEAFFGFEGGEVTAVANPDPSGANTSSTVGRMVKTPGPFWAGAFSHIDQKFRFSEENHTITMDVWSPRENVPVLMKIEQQTGDRTYETPVRTTTSGEWETMTWDMTRAGFTTEWDLITLIFDFHDGGSGDGSENFTWYFDNITVHGE